MFKNNELSYAVVKSQLSITAPLFQLTTPADFQMDKKKVKSKFKQAESNSSHELQTKLKLAAVCLFMLAIVIFPKPQRITYEYASMVSEGTYWDGLFGSGVLFDSNAKFVRLDEDTDHLHVCFNPENDNCLRYKVIENKGFVGYIASFFE